MVLAVNKHFQLTKLVTLNNYYKHIFSKISIAGKALDLGLHLGVFGAWICPDGLSCLETISIDKIDHLKQLSQKTNPYESP